MSSTLRLLRGVFSRSGSRPVAANRPARNSDEERRLTAPTTSLSQRRLESLVRSLKGSPRDLKRRHVFIKEAVRCLASSGHLSEIQDALEHQKQHIQPPEEQFSAFLIRLYGVAGMFDDARKLFDEMPTRNCQRTVKSLNSLLQAGLESKRFDEVEQLFRDLLEKLSVKPNMYSYNIVMAACCRIGSIDRALLLIDEIYENGLQPDIATFVPLLSASYKIGIDEGNRMWDLMESKKASPNAVAYHIKLQALAYNGMVVDAVQLFADMEKKNVIPDTYCYNALMSGFRKKGDAEVAKRWYRKLMASDCSPNWITMSTLIPFFRNKGDLEMAYELCAELMKKGFTVSSHIVQAVVDDLVRQSNLVLAEQLVRLDSSASKPRYNLTMPSGH